MNNINYLLGIKQVAKPKQVTARLNTILTVNKTNAIEYPNRS